MDSRELAALLTSLVSQLTILLILTLSPHSHSLTHSFEPIFSLINHFLSSSETTATFSLLAAPRSKRRRTHLPDRETHLENPTRFSKLGRLDRVNSVLVKTPDSFRLVFRMEPSTFEWLSGLLEPLLECRDPAGSPLGLPSELRLGIGLYRLSTGSSYSETGDTFRVTERVARFCCKQLCRVLCTNFRFWVGFPNSDELDSVIKKFEDLTGLPNCCGVMGCTRFKIIRSDNPNDLSIPSTMKECIAAQIVVDSSCRILSIFACSHGDKSSTRVLKLSTLYKDIEEGSLLNSHPIDVDGKGVPQYLVGECGYPLLPWLLTPFDDPKPGSNEEKFNASVGLMRVPMMRTVGSLRSWGVLSKPIKDDVKSVVAYVGACAILHNALLSRGDYSSLCDRVEDDSVLDHSLQHRRDRGRMEGSSIHGRLVRSALANKARELSSVK